MMIIRASIGFVPWEDFMMIVSRKQFEKMFPGRDYDEEIANLKNPQYQENDDVEDPTYK